MVFLCAGDEIPEGEGRAFEVPREGQKPLQVLVLQLNGQYYAYENACAHFGVRLDTTPGYSFIDEGEIVCQLHYARYDPASGECTGGECDNQGLRPLPIKIKDSAIYLSD